MKSSYVVIKQMIVAELKVELKMIPIKIIWKRFTVFPISLLLFDI